MFKRNVMVHIVTPFYSLVHRINWGCVLVNGGISSVDGACLIIQTLNSGWPVIALILICLSGVWGFLSWWKQSFVWPAFLNLHLICWCDIYANLSPFWLVHLFQSPSMTVRCMMVYLNRILGLILCSCCAFHCRGLHQELQRSLQPLAETLGWRGGQEGSWRGGDAFRRTHAVTSTLPHHRVDHFLLPALRHGPSKGD